VDYNIEFPKLQLGENAIASVNKVPKAENKNKNEQRDSQVSANVNSGKDQGNSGKDAKS